MIDTKFFLLIFNFFLFSCTQIDSKKQKCDVNPQFKARFEYYYKILENDFKGRGVVNGNMIRAIIFMSELSRIRSNVAFGDVTVYENTKDFNKDMSNWKKWYQQNRCNITESHIDSLESAVIKSTSWIEERYNLIENKN